MISTKAARFIWLGWMIVAISSDSLIIIIAIGNPDGDHERYNNDANNMNASTSIVCPICGESISDNVRECPICHADLSSASIGQQTQKTASAKKMYFPWHLAPKHAGQVVAERNMERKLKTVGQSLDSEDFVGALKVYRSVRKYASQLKYSKLFNMMLDLLEQSTNRLTSQKTALGSASRQSFESKPPRSLSSIRKLAWVPIFILAGIGLVAILNRGFFGSIEPIYTASTSNGQETDTLIPGHVTEALSTDGVVPIPSSTAIPDLAAISADNLEEVRELFLWSAGEESIVSLSFSPDGNFIASGTASGVTKVWDVWAGKVILEFEGTYAAFSPDGSRIAVAGKSGIFLYNLSSGELLYALDTKSPYYGVAFSPDSQLIAGGTEYGKMYIWSVNNGAVQQAAGGLGGNVHRLVFSRDGIFLAAASSSKTYIWNLQEKKIGRDIDFKRNKPVFFSTALDADGEWYAAGAENGQIYVWRVSNGESMPDLYDESPFVTGLEFLYGSNNPEILVSGDEVHLSFWVLQEYEFDNRSIYVSAPIQSLAVSPDNKLVATGVNDGVIHIWGVLP